MAATTNQQQHPTVTVKLLVDRGNNRVLFAESGADFVDILFSFLTLPLGAIVKHVGKGFASTCIDKLYQSVEELDHTQYQTKACKTMLLRPRSASEQRCEDLKINITSYDSNPRTIYKCASWDSSTKTHRLYSHVEDAMCPCGSAMDDEFVWTKRIADAGEMNGVFVTGGGAKFIITDDLRVFPSSTQAFLSSLNKVDVEGCTLLEESTIEVAAEEILNLLKRSLLSKAPLTDVFLLKLATSDDDAAATTELEPKDGILPKVEKDTDKESNKLNLKLLLSRSKNVFLYAEAGVDLVDFLFSFLTFAVGSIIKLLDKQLSSMHCLLNLYKCVEDLVADNTFAKVELCNSMLLSPKLAPHSCCTNHILGIEETAIKPAPARCQSCSSTGPIRCSRTVNITLRAINPKLENSGTECGGGFAKGPNKFMITDELVVTPFSSISAFQLLSRLKVSPSDIIEREVSLGNVEAMNLLKASLISKRPLSNVFCCKKMRSPAHF